MKKKTAILAGISAASGAAALYSLGRYQESIAAADYYIGVLSSYVGLMKANVIGAISRGNMDAIVDVPNPTSMLALLEKCLENAARESTTLITSAVISAASGLGAMKSYLKEKI